jgi:hypothetical protein
MFIYDVPDIHSIGTQALRGRRRVPGAAALLAYCSGGLRLMNQKSTMAAIATTRQAGRNKCMKRKPCGIFCSPALLCFAVSYLTNTLRACSRC